MENMEKNWSSVRDEWLSKTTLATELSLWAVDSLNKNENEIYQLEDIANNRPETELHEKLKIIRKAIKQKIIEKEYELDDLSLNSANSAKLQVSVPSSLNYLMKAWAAAEGRDLSSVALQCLEIGLRAMKSKGSIPTAAIERYDIACQKRIALAEVNNIWDKYESSNQIHKF